MKDKISVIIPSMNGEKTLPRCLDSILAQTYTNFEIIVVINKSSDSSVELLKKYTNNDQRIMFIVTPIGGVSRARNLGMKFATGDYLQFIDADDDVVPHMFEKLIKTFKETKADMVTYRFKHDCWKAFLPKGAYRLHDYKQGFKLYSDFFTFELPWNKMIRRKSITKPFDENVGIYEGSLFYLDNQRGIKKVVVLDDEFINYNNATVSGDNVSIVNEFLKSKFWENKTGYWYKFYELDARFRKALKAIYWMLNIDRFIQVRIFDLAFIELVKLIDAKVPAHIISKEMHNIFNETAFQASAKFFGHVMKNFDKEDCDKLVDNCIMFYNSFKAGEAGGEPFFKYIELFFKIICSPDDDAEMPQEFDLILETVSNKEGN